MIILRNSACWYWKQSIMGLGGDQYMGIFSRTLAIGGKFAAV